MTMLHLASPRAAASAAAAAVFAGALAYAVWRRLRALAPVAGGQPLPATTVIDTAVGALRVRCYSGGDGGASPPDVVLWSGLFFDDTQHAPLALALARAGLHVAAVSPPGFGGSTAAAVITMPACGSALLDVARALGARDCVLGGTSWGAIAAVHAACEAEAHAGGGGAPVRVCGLALFNMPVEGGSHRLPAGILPYTLLLPAPFFASGAAAPMFGRTSLRGDGAGGLLDALEASARGASTAGAVRAAVAVLCDRPDLSAAVRALPAPALVLLGDEDASAPPLALRRAWAPAVADRLADVVEVTGTGHSSALEAPGNVAGLFITFARKVLPRLANTR
jgi:pimeloyl-ACP methyl ester carboxylesterase